MSSLPVLVELAQSGRQPALISSLEHADIPLWAMEAASVQRHLEHGRLSPGTSGRRYCSQRFCHETKRKSSASKSRHRVADALLRTTAARVVFCFRKKSLSVSFPLVQHPSTVFLLRAAQQLDETVSESPLKELCILSSGGRTLSANHSGSFSSLSRSRCSFPVFVSEACSRSCPRPNAIRL